MAFTKAEELVQESKYPPPQLLCEIVWDGLDMATVSDLYSFNLVKNGKKNGKIYRDFFIGLFFYWILRFAQND